MGKRLNLQLELTGLPRIAISLPAVEQELVRELACRAPLDGRLAFAQTFAHAVVCTCWRARQMPAGPAPLPETLGIAALSTEARSGAERFGEAAAEYDARSLARFIGEIYTTALPAPYRAAHGIFYTPPELAERLLTMAEEAGVSWRSARVLDPACGGGAFLLPVARRMADALAGTEPAFILQQISARLRGVDVDPFGAWLAQAMIEMMLRDLASAARKSVPQVVEARDSLALSLAAEPVYDLVIGNPPYGRTSLSVERRGQFARSLHGHANLYGLFTDAALRWVKPGGVIGYVTPTSMLSGLYYKSLRALLVTEATPLAVDFVGERDGVFTDVLQETMLATYRRGVAARGGSVGFIAVGSQGSRYRKAGKIALPSRPEAPWLLPRSADQARFVRRLGSMPYRLAHYGYGVSTGPLVWNRFKTQFRREKVPGAYPVIWAESVTADGRFLWRSEKRNHAPWFVADRPKDDWLIVDRPCVLLQRTTAKEQSRRLIAAELPVEFIRRHKGVAIENHLNMVRALGPDPKLPPAVIAALLNSGVVDEAFRCINGSVAVSAFELEELPLPSPPVLDKLRKLLDASASREKIEAVISAAYKRTDAAGAA
ncbi:MAG TPA: N-6 DNA methylase [Stellaceae bacterium]|nr:N-6 DNA methylase [Stellaceae bacterium]